MLLVKKLFGDIDAAITKVSAEGGLSPCCWMARRVRHRPARLQYLYYSPTIDITQRVVDISTSTTPASPETPAAAPETDQEEGQASSGLPVKGHCRDAESPITPFYCVMSSL